MPSWTSGRSHGEQLEPSPHSPRSPQLIPACMQPSPHTDFRTTWPLHLRHRTSLLQRPVAATWKTSLLHHPFLESHLYLCPGGKTWTLGTPTQHAGGSLTRWPLLQTTSLVKDLVTCVSRDPATGTWLFPETQLMLSSSFQ